MLAEIRLITNAGAIEEAYTRLDEYNQKPSGRKPRIPKPKYRYSPAIIDPQGIKIAYREGSMIMVRHANNEDWISLKWSPSLWREIERSLNTQTRAVSGFGSVQNID